MHLDVKDIVAGGEKVVVRFANSDLRTGPFVGVPPTGRRVELLGIVIYTVRGSKIVYAWYERARSA